MEINFKSTEDNYGNVIISLSNSDELLEVANTLEFISKLLCNHISYDLDFDSNEITVFVNDYYEFLTLRGKLLDHCAIA